MSLKLLRKLLSAEHLLRRRCGLGGPRRAFCKSRGGQIATLALLTIAGALVMALALANIGSMSLNATLSDDTADSGALLLASLLSTKAHALWQALGFRTQKCQASGLLSSILAIVIAIIIIIIVLIFCAPCLAAVVAVGSALAGGAAVSAGTVAIAVASTVVAGAVGGAVGGAAGGAATGYGAAAGAIQGATIGAAIGAAVLGGVSAGASGFGSLVPVSAAAGGVGPPALVPGLIATIAPGAVGGLGFGATLGAVAGSAVAAGSSAYNAYVAHSLSAAAADALAKSTLGLRERANIRETVFQATLPKIVDDPNITPIPGADPFKPGCFWPDPVAEMDGKRLEGDPFDLDSDGDYTEQMPCFQVWMERRIQHLKDHTIHQTGLADALTDFFFGDNGRSMDPPDSPVEKFMQVLKNKYDFHCDDNRWGLMTRGDVESQQGPCWVSHNACKNPAHADEDGPLVKFARVVTTAGFPVSFWQPRPSCAELKPWLDNDTCGDEALSCPGNLAPPGMDDLDGMLQEIKSLYELLRDLHKEKLEVLTTSMDSWLPLFYDVDDHPAHKNDFYGKLNSATGGSPPRQVGWIARLKAWQAELDRVVPLLPVCNGARSNFPCRNNTSTFATIDQDPNNEYKDRKEDIQLFIDGLPADGVLSSIERFRTALQNFADRVNVQETDIEAIFGGKNPVDYHWKDSRGTHWVRVRLGPFTVPRLTSKASFTKSCIVLDGWSEDGTNTWVQVSRNDDVLGIGGIDSSHPLWDWNVQSDPVDGTLLRRSRAEYGFNILADGKAHWFVRLLKRPAKAP